MLRLSSLSKTSAVRAEGPAYRSLGRSPRLVHRESSAG